MTQYWLPSHWKAAAYKSGKLDFSSLRNESSIQAQGWLTQNVNHSTSGEYTTHPFLAINNANYPTLLAKVPYAPPVLFYMGNIQLLQERKIAIVGTRHATATGRDLATQYAQTVTNTGYVTISGLAYGIDEMVHLAAPARTIGVLGHGLAHPYNWHQRQLIETIIKHNGLIISEFNPKVPPRRWTYLQRNRVIAWLCEQLILVEAPIGSGALNTVHHAILQQKPIWVVPWDPHWLSGRGCLQLIEAGAPLVTDSKDLQEKIKLAETMPRTAKFFDENLLL